MRATILPYAMLLTKTHRAMVSMINVSAGEIINMGKGTWRVFLFLLLFFYFK